MAVGKKRKLNPLVVEREELVSEVRINSPELIRLRRVKYEGNDNFVFVDIRRFWRGDDEEGNEIFYPSTKGLQLKEDDFLKLISPYLDVAGRPLKREGPVH